MATTKTEQSVTDAQSMKGEKMAKAYEELEIRDDFMYGKATEDLEITKRILEMATGRKISNLRYAEKYF